MVRDIEKIFETLQEHEKKQLSNKVELIHACQELAIIVKELGLKTGETCVALDNKINVIKDFMVKQAEETTALRLRLNNLEDKLNAKN